MEQELDNLLKSLDDIHLIEISNVVTTEEYDQLISEKVEDQQVIINNEKYEVQTQS